MERVESLNRQYLRMTSEGNEGDGMEGYRSRILQKNRVNGLLQMDKRHLDGICYSYYDVTSMGSMEEIFADRKLTETCLEELFDGLETALQGMEAYLLKQSDLCLKPEYLMRNAETGRWAFLYVPGYGGNQAQDLERLTEYVMEHMDYSDEFLQERVYALYNDVIRSGGKALPSGYVQLWRKTGRGKSEISPPEETYEAACGGAEGLPQAETAEIRLPDVREREAETERKAEKSIKYVRKIYRTPYRGTEIQNVP